MDPNNHFVLLGVALAIGLLVGLERGWKLREAEAGYRVAGIRTYGLIGLLGGIIGLLQNESDIALAGVGLIGLMAVFTVAYVLDYLQSGDKSITSLIAGLLTFVFGIMAGLGFLQLAAAAGGVTMLILGIKPQLHGWVAKLAPLELKAILKMVVISVVALPVLPNKGYGPWQVFNPYQIWWMVVLISLISFVGYFAVKVAGSKKGLLFTGLFSGLASSTALTVSFSRLAKHQQDAPVNLLGLGILLACGTMFPRMLIVLSAINVELSKALLIPALVMMALVYLPLLSLLKLDVDAQASRAKSSLGNPFQLTTGLIFGAVLALIMLGAEALKHWLGERGVLYLAAASGIADVDAISLTLARMSQNELSLKYAATGVLIAAAVNSVVKAAMAMSIGGRALALRASIPLVVAAMVGLVVGWFLYWQ